MADRTLSIKIVGDSKDLSRALGTASKDADSFGHSSSTGGKAAKGLGLLAGGAALGGIALLGKGLMDGVQTAIEHQKALAQTNAVIKSTGGGAKVSAQHILDLSDKIEKMTGIDDLNTQAGANMLLTFTNIKNGAGAANKVFDKSVNVLADMTTALGSDPQKQAIQLGKALNDPVHGLTALQKVGVTFSAQQKENIKAMVAHGNTAGAQKVILAELTKEFGGSAKAAGGTMAGQLNILKAHLEDTEQMIGQKVLPVLNRLIGWAIANWPTFQHYAEVAMTAIQTAWDSVLKPTLDLIISVIGALVGQVKAHWDAIAQIFRDELAVITGIIDLFIAVFKGDWSAAWKAIKQIVVGEFNLIKDEFKLIVPILLGLAKTIGLKILDGLKDGLTGLVDLAVEGFKALPMAFLNLHLLLFNAAADLGGKIWDGVKGEVKDIAGDVAGFIGDIPGKLTDLLKKLGTAGTAVGSAVVDGITGAFKGLAGAVEGLVKSALNTAIGLANAGFNAIHDNWPDIPGAPGAPFGHNPIPKLADGGIVTSATLAMIGEAGPEAVIPLSGGSGGAGVGFGGVTVNVYGWVGNDQDIAERVRTQLIRMGRNTTGGALGSFG